MHSKEEREVVYIYTALNFPDPLTWPSSYYRENK